MGVAVMLIVALTITLGIHFAVWKMYWWLLPLSCSLASLFLIYGIIAVMTGRIALENINFPRF
jgi:hypothetical protein